jgi:predicted molibdopterin-dependent oxidoreductase YjgC
MRSDHDVVRGAPLSLTVDGQPAEAFDGETLASAMLAADRRAFRRDKSGRPRGLFCNMGVCSECLVDVATDEGATRRLRACMTPVVDGMTVTTGAAT